MDETRLPACIMSIDPGLDHTGVATFLLDPYVDWLRADFAMKCGALLSCELITTKPAWSMPERLAVLAKELRQMLNTQLPDRLFLEIPAVAGGAYRSKRGSNGAVFNAAAMDGFFQALGVITVVATELLGTKAVRLVKASTKQKHDRQRLLKLALRRVGKEKEAAYGSDRLDAIFAGAVEPWNLEPRRFVFPKTLVIA